MTTAAVKPGVARRRRTAPSADSLENPHSAIHRHNRQLMFFVDGNVINRLSLGVSSGRRHRTRLTVG